MNCDRGEFFFFFFLVSLCLLFGTGKNSSKGPLSVPPAGFSPEMSLFSGHLMCEMQVTTKWSLQKDRASLCPCLDMREGQEHEKRIWNPVPPHPTLCCNGKTRRNSVSVPRWFAACLFVCTSVCIKHRRRTDGTHNTCLVLMCLLWNCLQRSLSHTHTPPHRHLSLPLVSRCNATAELV